MPLACDCRRKEGVGCHCFVHSVSSKAGESRLKVPPRIVTSLRFHVYIMLRRILQCFFLLLALVRVPVACTIPSSLSHSLTLPLLISCTVGCD